MKNFILLSFFCTSLLSLSACSSNAKKSELKGEWRSKDGETRLKITGKEFIMDNGSPLPEDYIMKGDTILTSYEGSQPYTKFVIQQLDDHNLKLLYPDSITVEFTR
ncbi:hypothetical protein GCM10027037_19210 [Mucilaginibacter koreensis]